MTPPPRSLPPEARALSPQQLYVWWKKQGALEAQRLLKRREYRNYLLSFNNHERQHAFFKIHARLSHEEYWPLIREVWQMATVTYPHSYRWLRLFRSPRPGRERMMSPVEIARLASLPNDFPVFRGVANIEHFAGLSWTLSRAVAVRLAQYAFDSRRAWSGFRGTVPAIVSGWCNKCDVLAYLCAREEEEIVIPAGSVRNKKAESVTLAASSDKAVQTLAVASTIVSPWP